MLSDNQIREASVCLAEMLMQAVHRQALEQSLRMVADFSKKEDILPDDTVMEIAYRIRVPIETIRTAIERSL